jgi:hypothetical protein
MITYGTRMATHMVRNPMMSSTTVFERKYGTTP